MDNNELKKDKYILSSLYNALKVLDILSVTDNLGVTDIVKISGIDRTSVFKILYTLEKRDYVSKTADAKYRLGGKLAMMGDIVTERRNISEVAAPYMQELRNTIHETVSLSVLNANGRTIILQRVEGNSPGHVPNRIGFEIDAHTTATGKVLLAYLDPPMQKNMIQNLRYKIYTPHTITSPEQLVPVLETVRSQGYALDQDERYIGRSTMAAPVFDASKQCIAALSLVCSNKTFEKKQEIFLSTLLDISTAISREMNYYGDSL